MTRIQILACFAVIAVGCSTDDGSVVISGDVAGLDTLALRGDAMIANAGRLPDEMDSLRAIVEGRVPGVTPLPRESIVTASAGTLAGASEPPTTGGAALTVRAQARGDSMARAAAERYASGTSSASARSRSDSMQGTIQLIGTAPALQPVLKVSGLSAPIAMTGLAASGLQRLEGAEIVVTGLRTGPRDIVVSEYVVRRMHGVQAYDGTLNADGGSYSLTLSDGSGKKWLSSVPESLRGMSGARVWVTFADGSSVPRSYGLIIRR